MPVRLMIVDDHEPVRELVRAIVDDPPEDVVVSGEADGAEAALAAIDRIDPDIVVLDARMRAIGGLEAVARVAVGWLRHELRLGREGGCAARDVSYRRQSCLGGV